MALEPPVEEEYPSLEHAESVVCLHARLQGYALTRRNLVRDKRKPPTVRRRDMRCSKGGPKRGEGVLRDTGTRMTECPFEILSTLNTAGQIRKFPLFALCMDRV